MLNYGYEVLASEIAKFVNGIGLDPFYGFYHKRHVGFQALVYDIIEPFRRIVDYTVYKIVNRKDSKQRIKLNELGNTREGFIRMEYKLIRRFLELLEKEFGQKRKYEYRFGGTKTQDGLKSIQEITLAKIMVQNLAEYCTGKQKEFTI